MIAGVRQFKLINALGREYDMTRPDALLHAPDGLGWGTERTVNRLGMTYIGINEKEIHQSPSGEMVFRTYEEYGRFLSFCQQGGLVLCYKPLETWHYCECLISIQKSEIQWENNHLICPVQFTLLSYWYEKVVAQTAEPPEPVEPNYATVTGDPAVFTARYSYPIKELTVDIQGSQELNGYDKPWVGGRGKNLFNKDGEIIYGYWTQNGTRFVPVTNPNPNTSWCGQIIPIAEGETYTWSGNPTEGGTVSVWLSDASDINSKLSNVAGSAAQSRTVTAPNGAAALWLALKGNSRDGWSQIQFEKGSTATEYEPYSNICPITAFTSITITQTGNSENRTYDVELTGAGNVYKGTLNATTGELVVDRIVWTPNTALGMATYGNNKRFTIAYPTGNAPNYTGVSTFGISSAFDVAYVGTIADPDNATTIIGFPHSSVYMITMPSFTNVTSINEMSAWLQEIQPQIAYELATPQTYTLTPTQLSNLIGSNTIKADAGAVTVTYRTDARTEYKIYPYQYSYKYGDTAQNVFDISCDLPSYFKLTILGEATNPTWRLVVNGEIVKTGKVNAVITANQKMVVNTNPKEIELGRYNKNGTRISSIYGLSDFTTDRFFTIPKGESQLQVITEDETQPVVILEVLKHV